MSIIKSKPKYYSLRKILEKQAQYNIIIGERSNGKTYAVLEYAIKDYFNTGAELGIIRRFIEDFRGRRGASMFEALVENKVVEKYSKGEWTGIYYYSSRWYFCRYDDHGNRIKAENPFAYGFSLSQSEHDKSTSYPRIKNILFDEFITRTLYLDDEFIIFSNVLSTIIRQRDDVKIFMLGNTVNKYACPYVDEMGLKHLKQMKQGDIDVYTYGDSDLIVAVEYCNPNREGKPSNKYFAFDNPKLSMITGGTWEIDVYPHLPARYKPRDVVLYFYIYYAHEWLKAEIIVLSDMQFIFVHPQTKPLTDDEKRTSIIYSPEYNPLPNWIRRITEPRTKIAKKIANMLYDDKIYYATNETGEILRNYLLWCTKSDL